MNGANETTTTALEEVRQGGALSTEVINYEEDAGLGHDYRAAEMATPFLQVLQKGSPQVDPDNGKYIEGAKAGMIHNTVTNELFDGKTGIVVIPAAFQARLVEWVPRDEGGGFVAQHLPGSEAVKDAKPDADKPQRLKLGDNELIDTHYHFVLALSDKGVSPAVISMTSTNLKASRNWNTTMSGMRFKGKTEGSSFKPPSFALRFRLKTAYQQKDNYTWYTWVVESDGVVTDRALYEMGKVFNTAVRDGSVRVTAPVPDAEGTSSDEGTGEGGNGTGEGKKPLPF